MKQKLLYIIMYLICAFTWSGEAWGESGYKTVTDVVEFNPSGSTLNNVTDGTASFSKSTNITGFVDSGTSASVTFSIGGNISGTKNDLQLEVPTGYQNSRTCTIQRSISSSYYSITFTEVSTAMKASAATTTPTVTLTDANGNSDSEQLGNLTSSQKTISLKNSNVVMPISVKCEKKAKWTPAVTTFYFYSFTFKYTLSHQELILDDLTEAITNATNLQNSLSNATLKGYMTTAISNANTFKESCRFPSYIDNNVKPSDVDNATAKLNAVKDYVTALNTALSYERTSVPDVIYNQLRQYYGNTPVDPNTKTATELTNTYTKNLNAAITLAENTKNAYATAISHYNAAVTENTTNHNNNSTIATEIQNAKNDLEASTTVEAITTAQNKFIAIKAKLEAITAFKTVKATAASYNKDDIPDAVYNLLHQYDNDNPYDDYATADVVNAKKSKLEEAIAAANATTAPYLSAVSTLNTFENEYPSKTTDTAKAAEDLVAARSALEASTSIEAIANALKKVKNFDSITFNGATSIAMGGSITNPAHANSNRDISYSVPNGTTAIAISGTTLNAISPGQVTVTATTGSTGEGYYECQKTQEYEILPVFYFSVDAQVGTGGGGSVSLEGNQSSVTGAAWDTPSASLNLKFKATPDDGYTFLGWGTTAGATSYESVKETYELQLTNNAYGQANEVNKTLYAIFAPVFNFAATYTKNREGGSVTASVANSTITGAPGDASASTTATFTATATAGSYVFKGWKTAANASSYVSQLNPYTTPNNDPDLINSTPGSTATKILVAIFAPLYNFSATAEVGSVNGGTVSVSGYSTQVEAAPDATEGTTTATFTATADDGYKFVGWSESANGNIVYTDNPHNQTLTNSSPGNTESLTLYAIFKLDRLELNPGNPNYTPDNYSSVTLSRTLKAGYSTIALPFDTSVEELVNGRTPAYDSDDDWVAQLDIVTYSAVDGYTLYFQRVTGGTIAANEPYVLHLGSQVVNPTWTDLTDGINVEEAEAASIGASTGYSGYAGWVMHSNFTPNFAMAGKYGIVNSEGGLMLGSGSSAKLNAFTAYITAPQANPAPRLRVAYVNTDGTTTFIGSLPEEDLQGEPVAIYGPDGQRRSKMQRGVNIVRFADGTTRKVQY